MFIIWWRKLRDTSAAFQSPTALALSFSPGIWLFSLSSEESTSSPAPALPSSCSLFHIWRIPDMLRNLLLFQFLPNFIACSSKVFLVSQQTLFVCSNLNTKSVLQCIVAVSMCLCTLFSVFAFTIAFPLCIFPKWVRNWGWVSVRIVCEPKDQPFSRQKTPHTLVTSCQSKKELVHPKSLYVLDWLCVLWLITEIKAIRRVGTLSHDSYGLALENLKTHNTNRVLINYFCRGHKTNSTI